MLLNHQWKKNQSVSSHISVKTRNSMPYIAKKNQERKHDIFLAPSRQFSHSLIHHIPVAQPSGTGKINVSVPVAYFLNALVTPNPAQQFLSVAVPWNTDATCATRVFLVSTTSQRSSGQV